MLWAGAFLIFVPLLSMESPMPRPKKTPEPLPIGYAALLIPFADLAFPILPEPALSDEQTAAIRTALEAMRDEDAEPIAVVLDGADLAQTSTALRRTAERMGLGVTFYVRAAREAVAPEVGVRGVVRHHGREASPAALMVARRKP